MKAIDLTKFATYSQKLPKSFLHLGTPKKEVIPTFKLLGGYFADFILCVGATSFMAQVYNLSVQSLLVTKGLRGAFAPAETAKLGLALLPLTVFCYFFLCYFMNQGQTWGMHFFKTRLEMKPNSFKEAAYWAVKSLLVCFTSGLYYAFNKGPWSAVHQHDYLYQSLMIPKDISTFSLLDKVSEFETEEVPSFEEAA